MYYVSPYYRIRNRSKNVWNVQTVERFNFLLPNGTNALRPQRQNKDEGWHPFDSAMVVIQHSIFFVIETTGIQEETRTASHRISQEDIVGSAG